MIACQAGNAEIASLLLEKQYDTQNPDMGFRDFQWNTPLHFAVIGDHKMVKPLLEKISHLDNDQVVLNQIVNSTNKVYVVIVFC